MRENKRGEKIRGPKKTGKGRRGKGRIDRGGGGEKKKKYSTGEKSEISDSRGGASGPGTKGKKGREKLSSRDAKKKKRGGGGGGHMPGGKRDSHYGKGGISEE